MHASTEAVDSNPMVDVNVKSNVLKLGNKSGKKPENILEVKNK